MKRFLVFVLIMALVGPAYGANLWRNGTGEDTILGTENASDIDAASFQNIVDPLDRLLTGYTNARLEYTTAATLTVTIGSAVCANSDKSIKRMRYNTTATTVTWADIDTGAEAGSTTYYVYAVADADATTFTISISTDSTSPDSKTYYLKLGSFYNDSGSDIDAESIVGSDMAIVTGTVAHGGTIPLPNGYTQGQCKWIVSPYSMKFTENGHDSGSTWTIDLQCRASTARVVTCYSSNPIQTSIAGTANYIIIGMK